MTRNRNVADVQANGVSAVPTVVAGKNAVINGGMDIWQRGTSFTSPNNVYTADRWTGLIGATAPATTISRQVTGDTTNLSFIQYCARVQRTSGQTNTGNIYLTQSFENINSTPFIGKTITFSFYARKGANYSAASSLLSGEVNSGTGTDQNINSSFTGNTQVTAISAALTTTWQRFSFTGTVSATATQLGFYFYYTPTGTAGTNDYFEVTGVQLEVGSQATPFSRNAGTIQGELAACQRYYYRNTPNSLYGGVAQGVVIVNTTTALVYLQFPVTMRTTPTSAEWGNLMLHDSSSGNYALSAVTVTALNSGPNIIGFEITSSGLTANRTAVLRNNNNAAGYLGFSAEL